MRALLFLLFALSITSLFAGQPDSLKTKKWAIGLTYSPDYCYRVSYIKAGDVPAANTTEKGKIGFTAGANLLYRLLDRVGIEFGVLYSTKGQKITTPSVEWQTPGSNNSPSTYVIIPEKLTTYTYKYLEIPLKVNVYIINKRFKLFPSIGCSANIFMGKSTHTSLKYEEGWKNETSNAYDSKNIPTTEFAILAGIGLSYDINKKLFIKLEPSYRTFVRPLIDGAVSGTLYSAGANAGVYYNF
jgi:opacity protein-like surface antigen